MAGVERTDAEVRSALPPDFRYVIFGPESDLAPEHERRAAKADLRVLLIVDQVDARPGPVVLAGGVDRCLVEAAVILGCRFFGQRASGPAPFIQGPAQVKVRVCSDQPLRYV